MFMTHSFDDSSESPAQRLTGVMLCQGLSIFALGEDLVLYGGDKSGLAVCNMTGADWKWAAPAITGKIVC